MVAQVAVLINRPSENQRIFLLENLLENPSIENVGFQFQTI